MGEKRNVATNGKLRRGRVALASWCVLAAACTPIADVSRTIDAGAVTALEPGTCHVDDDCPISRRDRNVGQTICSGSQAISSVKR